MPSSNALRPYVSDLLLRRLAARPDAALAADEERLSGAALFVDVTGFTALAERLARRGPAGAELLTDILNDCFGTVIAAVLAHGGDVALFAGDAVAVVWPDGEARTGALRAARCARALQDALEARAPYEGVRLRARVGIARGALWSGCVGGCGGRWAHLVAGEAVARAAWSAAQAPPGGASQTPVDLSAYASWKDEERVAAAGGGGRLSIVRRPGLDLPITPLPAPAEQGSEGPGAEFEPASPLDVPAFLRRQSEA